MPARQQLGKHVEELLIVGFWLQFVDMFPPP